MATPTYTLIDSTTLTTTASSVTFSSISATGKGDLVLVVNAIANGGTIAGYLEVNGDTGSNYSIVNMRGNGSAASSLRTTQANFRINVYDTYALTGQSFNSITILQDFATTDKHKSILSRSNNAALGTEAMAGRWANTSAITSVKFFTINNSYAVGSTFHLYQLVSE